MIHGLQTDGSSMHQVSHLTQLNHQSLMDMYSGMGVTNGEAAAAMAMQVHAADPLNLSNETMLLTGEMIPVLPPSDVTASLMNPVVPTAMMIPVVPNLAHQEGEVIVNQLGTVELDCRRPASTLCGLRAPTETRIHSCGPSWCDLIWKPVAHANNYVIFIRSRLTEINEAEHNLRYHLRIPETAILVKACRFRIEKMLPSRLYEIHVAAGDPTQQIGPLSETLVCRTAQKSAAPRCLEVEMIYQPSTLPSVTVFKHKYCDLVSSKRKRAALHMPKETVPVVPCVVLAGVPPKTASSCVMRSSWNPAVAKTLQCKFPACGQMFKLYGNKTRHEKSCRRDVCEAEWDSEGRLVFKLHCRWQNCDHTCQVYPDAMQNTDNILNFDVQTAIPLSFMEHLEAHMPKISTKAQRAVQVWCQWRGCHKVPMYAQSLHRHVKESHVGSGNRYNTGQGGVPIQTEAGKGIRSPLATKVNKPLIAAPIPQVPIIAQPGQLHHLTQPGQHHPSHLHAQQVAHMQAQAQAQAQAHAQQVAHMQHLPSANVAELMEHLPSPMGTADGHWAQSIIGGAHSAQLQLGQVQISGSQGGASTSYGGAPISWLTCPHIDPDALSPPVANVHQMNLGLARHTFDGF